MIASVHIADVGARSAVSMLRRTPKPGTTFGLRSATMALAAPLRASFLPSPDLRRVGLIAFWDDDDSLDRFAQADPLAAAFGDGWQVRLQPVRAHGAWPGLPADVAASRASVHEGPAAVLTLGRLRLTQTIRFLRTSARAEARVLCAPGLVWATGLGRPPFVATCSLWEDTRSLATYAYGSGEPAHSRAISSGKARPFHQREAFIRFRPYVTRGSLGGTNPLAESWLSALKSKEG